MLKVSPRAQKHVEGIVLGLTRRRTVLSPAALGNVCLTRYLYSPPPVLTTHHLKIRRSQQPILLSELVLIRTISEFNYYTSQQRQSEINTLLNGQPE